MNGQGGNRSSAHTSLLRDAQAYLQLRGAWTMRLRAGLGMVRGAPDLFCIIGGRAVAIDAKTGNAQLSPVQRQQQEAITAAGGIFIVLRDLDGLENTLVDAGLVSGRVLRPLRKREG